MGLTPKRAAKGAIQHMQKAGGGAKGPKKAKKKVGDGGLFEGDGVGGVGKG